MVGSVVLIAPPRGGRSGGLGCLPAWSASTAPGRRRTRPPPSAGPGWPPPVAPSGGAPRPACAPRTGSSVLSQPLAEVAVLRDRQRYGVARRELARLAVEREADSPVPYLVPNLELGAHDVAGRVGAVGRRNRPGDGPSHPAHRALTAASASSGPTPAPTA